MEQRHHTPEQVIRKFAEGDKLLNQGEDLPEACRHLEIAESTWHRWKGQFGGMKANNPTFRRSVDPFSVIFGDRSARHAKRSGGRGPRVR